MLQILFDVMLFLFLMIFISVLMLLLILVNVCFCELLLMRLMFLLCMMWLRNCVIMCELFFFGVQIELRFGLIQLNGWNSVKFRFFILQFQIMWFISCFEYVQIQCGLLIGLQVSVDVFGLNCLFEYILQILEVDGNMRCLLYLMVEWMIGRFVLKLSLNMCSGCWMQVVGVVIVMSGRIMLYFFM